MSYSAVQNFTPIEMLPELEDLEKGNGNNLQQSMPTETNIYNNTHHYPGEKMLPPGEAEKFGRYIRGNHQMPQQSGMTYYNHPSQSQQTGYYPNMEKHGFPLENNLEMESNNREHAHAPKYALPDNSPSCIDVANHIAACPICSKYYDNNNTVYIISIIILSIICILLLKKVLDI